MKIYNTDNNFLFESTPTIIQIGSCFHHEGILYQIKGIISNDTDVDLYVSLTDRNSYIANL